MQVINIRNKCAHRVPPKANLHFYAASQFALRALTEGLRQELAAESPTKIRVAVRSKQLPPRVELPQIVELTFRYDHIFTYPIFCG